MLRLDNAEYSLYLACARKLAKQLAKKKKGPKGLSKSPRAPATLKKHCYSSKSIILAISIYLLIVLQGRRAAIESKDNESKPPTLTKKRKGSSAKKLATALVL